MRLSLVRPDGSPTGAIGTWSEDRIRWRPRTLAVVAAVALGVPALTACNGSTDDSSTATPSAVTTSVGNNEGASASASAPPDAASAAQSGDAVSDITDVERVMEHIHYLSVVIGPRPAGSEQELAVAAYLADELEAAGYIAEFDEFTFEAHRDNSLVQVGDRFLIATAMRGSPNGEAQGETVFAGLGEPADMAGADLQGNVVIFDRGVVTFRDKAMAAQAGGAVAALIVNNEPGYFFGSLGEDTGITIPVLAVSGEDGEFLKRDLGRTLTVTADVGMEAATSQNVVGRLGDRCHAYIGAHYDSVPPSPGANDNASGVAVVLEVARVQRIDGLCVLFFGAEEVGLFGSRHYVANNLVGMARFMLNVDMAGRINGGKIIGDEALTDLIRDAAPGSGLRPGVFPPFASSDHAPFSSVGVPAVTLTGGEDEALHTPLDTIARIDRGALLTFLTVLLASLDALVEEHSRVLTR